MIKCKICGQLCKRVCTHARLKHKISAREYKEEFGYDVKKGIMTDEDRQHMRELAYKNGMPERLKKAGEKTRFKKGQKGLGLYERSNQTLKRLKQSNPPIRKRERFMKTCQICGKKYEVIKSRIDSKFCSRHCSVINNNKTRKGVKK